MLYRSIMTVYILAQVFPYTFSCVDWLITTTKDFYICSCHLFVLSVVILVVMSNLSILQLLVSFWQDKSEHVRMAARSIFHCAASRAIPAPLCHQETSDLPKIASPTTEENEQDNLNTDDEILSWLESYEMQDWISCIGGTSQDAMTSHIIVASALSIWYPSRIKPTLPTLVINPLIKLVMAMNEKYSSTAAELLAEGMESTWKACIGPEIHRLIGDIFFQIECVTSATSASQPPAVPVEIRETLVGVLLPSLAMADVLGFLTVIESQIWSTASDSPVHLVSLMILIRVVKGAPRNLAQYLDKVSGIIGFCKRQYNFSL